MRFIGLKHSALGSRFHAQQITGKRSVKYHAYKSGVKLCGKKGTIFADDLHLLPPCQKIQVR